LLIRIPILSLIITWIVWYGRFSQWGTDSSLIWLSISFLVLIVRGQV
jgi:hypothetical protein